MNLLPMRYFITIAEQRSISRAAAELHVTQQTLSAHIAAMEQELSCCLFQRRPSFRLTYAGEVFLRYCRQFDTLMNAMQEEFSDISARRSGVLRIGITQTRGKILMPGVIREYRARCPDMQVEIKEGSNEELISMLLADEIDLMIGSIAPDTPEFIAQPLFEETLCIFYSPQLLREDDHAEKQQLADFAAYPFLLCEEADILGRWAKLLLESAHIVPRIASRSRNIETLLRLCVAGCGVCICTDYFADNVLSADERGSLCIVPTGKSYPISVIRKDRPYVSQTITAFTDVLRRHL